MNAIDAYRAALSACPSPGCGVHGWLLGTGNHAAYAGIPQEEAAAEIRAAMTRPPTPASEIWDALGKAYAEREVERSGPFPPPSPRPKKEATSPTQGPAPDTLAACIRLGGGEVGEEAFAESSPVTIWTDWTGQACAFLRALFKRGEFVNCGVLNAPDAVRERDAWIAAWMAGETIPPFVCVNPLRKGGKRRAADVAAHRHTLAEFDALPLPQQLAFWRWWGAEDGAVSALTFSGGKSYHALLRVDVADAAAWGAEVVGRLFRGVLIPLGMDPANHDPCRLSRIPGAWRVDERHPDGVQQRMFFCREELG